MRRMRRALVALWLGCIGFGLADAAAVVVGSKRFTESLHARRDRRADAAAGRRRRPSTGRAWATPRILEQALASGAIDVYPEYTGTIVRELLKRDGAEAARPRSTSSTPGWRRAG